MSELQDKFKFYIPNVDIIEKAGKGKSEGMKIRGIASTNDVDSDGEMLDVNGMDLSDFKWINWNHRGKDDSAAIIGEPTVTSIVDGKQLYIEGVLYPEVPMAVSTYDLMKAVKNSKRGNKLCLSVEGKVTERDPLDPKKVSKSRITAVAICPTPVNGSTWTDLISKGYTDEMKFDDDEEESKKAFTAEGNQHTKKESIEGTDREDDEELEEEENTQKGKKYLQKSEVYSYLYSYFYDINDETPSTELVKSAYNLIERTMSEENKGKVTQEDINKAMEILNLAKAPEITLEKAQEMRTSFVSENAEAGKEDIVKHLIEKGVSEDLAEKACVEVKSDKDKGDKEVEKSETKGEDLSKSVSDTISKSFESIQKSFADQMSAMGTLVTSQTEKIEGMSEIITSQNEVLKSQTDFIGEMKKRVETVENNSQGRKSIVKGYGERFEKGQGGDGENTYNMSDSGSRTALKTRIEEESGLSKGQVTDENLAKIAGEIEIAKSVSPTSLRKLQGMGIHVLQDKQ